MTPASNEPVEIPEGYVPFGWSASQSLYGPMRESLVHLAPAEQGVRPWESLCGRRRTARGAHLDTHLEDDLARGARKPCQRCLKLAREAAAQ